MTVAAQPQDKLKAAWEKFRSRVAKIRSLTRGLMATMDERKRQQEMDDLRKKIGGNSV